MEMKTETMEHKTRWSPHPFQVNKFTYFLDQYQVSSCIWTKVKPFFLSKHLFLFRNEFENHAILFGSNFQNKLSHWNYTKKIILCPLPFLIKNQIHTNWSKTSVCWLFWIVIWKKKQPGLFLVSHLKLWLKVS